ncbi:exodeoxyribonuclease-3 [Kytococcus aerolatus]|uniref:Exodeoxyribonuclease-3 n=1 Tax=Kytococcus aerolatus TaxID=592308 RepID=A0A212U5F6_9MICO|nr:exodeoxyribonuclease III [Kytococcus aerolatus]SNC73314.1 exodeoxyribonuclease-3 [Kytococcus aerolatus]
MRIATWNVNSLRARLDRVTDFLERHDVDVLAIQETKVKDEKFPRERFDELGYEIAFHGLNQWNGVAIASRVGLEDVTVAFPDQPGFGADEPVVEARALGATVGGQPRPDGSPTAPLRLWSLYVPNGREIDHPHMQYKLEWLERLAGHARQWAAEELPLALVGDFNVAPLDTDVWDMAAFEGATHVTEPERAAFNAFLEAGLVDVVRPFTETDTYTYWDYQQLRFPKRQGMRIDFVLASAGLAGQVTHAFVDREERKGKGASDHAPVVVDLTDPTGTGDPAEPGA